MKNQSNYPLTERTALFGEKIIYFCKSTKFDDISRPILNQLIRSGTSVGANYMEANNASSKRDFRNKIFLCKKEAQETSYWLRMFLSVSDSSSAQNLSQEAHELTMIFQKIVSTIDK